MRARYQGSEQGLEGEGESSQRVQCLVMSFEIFDTHIMCVYMFQGQVRKTCGTHYTNINGARTCTKQEFIAELLERVETKERYQRYTR